MRQSILKNAFEGKLIPQTPDDEPAEKLLERIEAERFNNNKSKSNNQLELSSYVK
jgi:type I restriction enzyme S subunit